MDTDAGPIKFNELQGRQDFIASFPSWCKSGEPGGQTGLLLVRLLNLRAINASYGYEAGDRVISEFIARVQGVLRESDHMAFFGDHTLAICIPELLNPNHVILPANKISSQFEHEIRLDGEVVKAGTAIGIALCPLHSKNVEELVQAAEAALYLSRHGGDNYVLYDKAVFDEDVKRTAMIEDLRQAIEAGDLQVYYQPQVHLENNRLYGFESLLRWTSDKHGTVPPDVFVSLAEQAGLIFDLSKWSIFASFKCFKEICKVIPDVKLSFNISPILLDDHDIVQTIQNAISIWDIAPSSLVLEVTEGLILRNQERSLEILQRLRETGCEISLDDFGTGFSSLSYLHMMPVSELKLDKSFIIGLESSNESQKMTKAIIGLGHNFDLRVVAEGVESKGARDILKQLNCEVGQGYYFSMPIPVDEVCDWALNSPYV
jgi:diguanylate cyclase (GGDEF)-like protein